jgi:hypothetical protein
MIEEFSETEKAELRELLASPVYRKATGLSLQALWRSRRGAVTLEESGLAHHYHQGACDVLEGLQTLAMAKKEFAPSPTRLRHDA